MLSSNDRDGRARAAAALASRLRAAGCVFAEDEAAILLDAAGDDVQLEALVRRRETGEPLEQLVGWVDFGGLRLSTGTGVFVPRQRTLLLARAALRVLRTQREPVLLELFCGVAPIAATVARALPEAELHVADIDPAALVHAERNLPASAGLHLGEGFAALPAALRGRVTLIACVPPYVPAREAQLLPHDALSFEPERALLGGEDGLEHVRALVDAAGRWLAPQGRVLVELNRGQYSSAAAHARRLGYRTARHAGADGQTVLLGIRR